MHPHTSVLLCFELGSEPVESQVLCDTGMHADLQRVRSSWFKTRIRELGAVRKECFRAARRGRSRVVLENE